MSCLARFAALLLAASLAPATSAGVLVDPETAAALERGESAPVVVQLRERSIAQRDARSSASARALRDQLKAQVLAHLPASQMELRRRYSELPMFAATLRDPTALQRLLADPDVEAVFPDKVLKMHLAQALPQVSQPEVANVLGRRGAGTTVAVLDTGVDYTRSELGSCTAPGAPASCRVVAAYEAATEDNARDANGHGTLVALTTASTAGQANIAALDVFNGDGAASSDIIEAINWVISNQATYNIVAINMSLGDGAENASACSNRFTDPFVQPVRNAHNAGIVVVASSGNESHTNGISSPACVTEAVAVGAVYDANSGRVAWSGCTDATTAVDQVTCFSSSGAPLDLLAPGALITVGGSTVGGTSFSAPIVAGAVAVLKAAFPSETPAQIEARLANGDAVTDTRNGLVRPRLDLLQAQGAPSNDAYAAAIGLGQSGSVSSWNYNASAESGEPAHAGVAGGRSLWWQWTAPADGSLSLDTAGSAIDTLLAVYLGSTVSTLSAQASNDNAAGGGTHSALTLAVVAGQSYRIAVDGKAGAQGALNLAYSFSAYSADLGVSLTSTPQPAYVGNGVTLGASLSNSGPDSAAAVSLSVSLPAELGAPLTLPEGCSHDTGVVRCSLGTLAAGAVQQLLIQATVLAAGEVQITAEASSDTADPDNGNNAASVAATLSSSTSGGGDGGGDDGPDGDVPLPGWALLALAAGLLGLAQRRQR